MRAPRFATLTIGLCSLLVLGSIAGCGNGSGPEERSAQADPPNRPVGITARAEIPSAPKTDLTEQEAESAATDALNQIILIRNETFPKDGTLAQIRAIRTERSREIVELANRAVALTHGKKSQSKQFDQAVHELLEARLSLALGGNADDIQALYDDAEALFANYPDSEAAFDAHHALTRFAHTNAQRYGEKNEQWLDEFSRRARMFAKAFENRPAQTVPLLSSAAFSCEVAGRIDQAKLCYTQLANSFPETGPGQMAVGTLRRLNLPGTAPALSGPTIDGGFVSLSDYRGKVTVVAFWASDVKNCDVALKTLSSWEQAFSQRGFRIIGVNLDQEEIDVERALEQVALGCPQIFHSDPAKRRWESPIVKYYGLRKVPQFWVLGRDGTLVGMTHSLPETQRLIEGQLAK